MKTPRLRSVSRFILAVKSAGRKKAEFFTTTGSSKGAVKRALAEHLKCPPRCIVSVSRVEILHRCTP